MIFECNCFMGGCRQIIALTIKNETKEILRSIWYDGRYCNSDLITVSKKEGRYIAPEKAPFSDTICRDVGSNLNENDTTLHVRRIEFPHKQNSVVISFKSEKLSLVANTCSPLPEITLSILECPTCSSDANFRNEISVTLTLSVLSGNLQLSFRTATLHSIYVKQANKAILDAGSKALFILDDMTSNTFSLRGQIDDMNEFLQENTIQYCHRSQKFKNGVAPLADTIIVACQIKDSERADEKPSTVNRSISVQILDPITLLPKDCVSKNCKTTLFQIQAQRVVPFPISYESTMIAPDNNKIVTLAIALFGSNKTWIKVNSTLPNIINESSNPLSTFDAQRGVAVRHRYVNETSLGNMLDPKMMGKVTEQFYEKILLRGTEKEMADALESIEIFSIQMCKPSVETLAIRELVEGSTTSQVLLEENIIVLPWFYFSNEADMNPSAIIAYALDKNVTKSIKELYGPRFADVIHQNVPENCDIDLEIHISCTSGYLMHHSVPTSVPIEVVTLTAFSSSNITVVGKYPDVLNVLSSIMFVAKNIENDPLATHRIQSFKLQTRRRTFDSDTHILRVKSNNESISGQYILGLHVPNGLMRERSAHKNNDGDCVSGAIYLSDPLTTVRQKILNMICVLRPSIITNATLLEKVVAVQVYSNATTDPGHLDIFDGYLNIQYHEKTTKVSLATSNEDMERAMEDFFMAKVKISKQGQRNESFFIWVITFSTGSDKIDVNMITATTSKAVFQVKCTTLKSEVEQTQANLYSITSVQFLQVRYLPDDENDNATLLALEITFENSDDVSVFPVLKIVSHSLTPNASSISIEHTMIGATRKIMDHHATLPTICLKAMGYDAFTMVPLGDKSDRVREIIQKYLLDSIGDVYVVDLYYRHYYPDDIREMQEWQIRLAAHSSLKLSTCNVASVDHSAWSTNLFSDDQSSLITSSNSADVRFKVFPRIEFAQENTFMDSIARIFILQTEHSMQCSMYSVKSAEEIHQVQIGDRIRIKDLQIKRTQTICTDPCQLFWIHINATEGKIAFNDSRDNQPQHSLNVTWNLDVLSKKLADGFDYYSTGRAGYHIVAVTISCAGQHTTQMDALITTEIPVRIISPKTDDSLTIHVPFASLDLNFDEKAHIFGIQLQNPDGSYFSVNVDIWVKVGELSLRSLSAYASLETEWSPIWNLRGSIAQINKMLTNIQYRTVMCKAPINKDHFYIAAEIMPQISTFTATASTNLSVTFNRVERRISLHNVFIENCLEVFLGRSCIRKETGYILGQLNQPIPLTNLSVKAYFNTNIQTKNVSAADQHVEIRLAAREGKIACDELFPYNDMKSNNVLIEKHIDALNQLIQNCQYLPPHVPLGLNETDEIKILGQQITMNESVNQVEMSILVLPDSMNDILIVEWPQSIKDGYSLECTVGQDVLIPSLVVRVNPPSERRQRLYTVEIATDEGNITSTSSTRITHENLLIVSSTMNIDGPSTLRLTHSLSDLNQILGKLWFSAPIAPKRSYSHLKYKVWPINYPQNAVHEYLLVNLTWKNFESVVDKDDVYLTSTDQIFRASPGENVSICGGFNIPKSINISSNREVFALTLKAHHGLLTSYREHAANPSVKLHVTAPLHEIDAHLLNLHYKSLPGFTGIDQVRASIKNYNHEDLNYNTDQSDELWIAIKVATPPVKVQVDFISPTQTAFPEWLERSSTLLGPSLHLSTMIPVESLRKHHILHVYLQANFATFQPKSSDLGPDYDGIHVNTSRLPLLLQLTGTYSRLKSALRDPQVMMVPRTNFWAHEEWTTFEVKACTRFEDDQNESGTKVCSGIKTKMRLITSALVKLVRKDTSNALHMLTDASSPLSKLTYLDIVRRFSESSQIILILEVILSSGRFTWTEKFQCSNASDLLQRSEYELGSLDRDARKAVRVRSTIRCLNEFMAATHVKCENYQTAVPVSINIKVKQLAWSAIDVSSEHFVLQFDKGGGEHGLKITPKITDEAIAITYADVISLPSIINIPVPELEEDVVMNNDAPESLFRLTLLSPLHMRFDEKKLVQGLSHEFVKQNSTNLTFMGSLERLHQILHYLYLIPSQSDLKGAVQSPTPILQSYVNISLYRIEDHYSYASSVLSNQHFAVAYQVLERRLSWMLNDVEQLDRHQMIRSNGGVVSFSNIKLRGKDNAPDLQLNLIVEWLNDSLKVKRVQETATDKEHESRENSTEKLFYKSNRLVLRANRRTFDDLLHSVLLYFDCENFDQHEIYDLRLTAKLLVGNFSENDQDHATLGLSVLPDACFHGESDPMKAQTPKMHLRDMQITIKEDEDFNDFGRVIRLHFDDSSLLSQDYISSTAFQLSLSVTRGLLSLPDTICCIELRTSHISSEIVTIGALSGLRRVLQNLRYIPHKDYNGEDKLDLSLSLGQYVSRILQTEQLLILIEAENDSPTIDFRRTVNSNEVNKSHIFGIYINDPDLFHNKSLRQTSMAIVSLVLSSGSLSFQSEIWMENVILMSKSCSPGSHDRFLSITIQGSLYALNHLLERMYYFPALSNHQTCVGEKTKLIITVNDLGHGSLQLKPKITTSVQSISHNCMPMTPMIVVEKNNRLIYDNYSDKVLMDGNLSIVGTLDDQIHPSGEIENNSRCQLEIKCFYLIEAEVQELQIKEARHYYSFVLQSYILDRVTFRKTFQLQTNLSLPGRPIFIKQVRIYVDAVAMRSDEVPGQFGNGHGLGESVESAIQMLYEDCGMEFGLIITKHSKFHPERLNKWTIVLTETTDPITSLPLPFSILRVDESVKVTLRVEQHLSAMTGKFRLKLGEEITQPIPTDATSLQLQEALEDMETVQMVHVSPRAGKLHWGITFFNYWDSFPVLEGITTDKNGQSNIFPVPTFVGAGEETLLNSGATIKTTRIKKGTGHGTIFEVVVGAHPRSIIYRLATFANSVLSGSFQIGLFDSNGRELARTSEIYYNAEASIPVESDLSKIGALKHRSLELELLTAIGNLPRIIGLHNIDIEARKVVTDHHLRLSDWTITFTKCSHDFPVFKIVNTANLRGDDARAQFHILQETENLGGTFSVAIDTTSLNSPHTFSWNVEASILEEALNYEQLDDSTAKGTPKYHVRRRRHGQNGYAYGILLLSQTIPLRLNSASRIPIVDGTNLTGLGAFAQINIIDKTFQNDERELSNVYALSWTKMPQSDDEFPEFQNGAVNYRMDATSMKLKAKSPWDLIQALPRDLELQIPKYVSGGQVQLSFTLSVNYRHEEHVSTQKTSIVDLPTSLKADAFVIRKEFAQDDSLHFAMSGDNFTLAGLYVDAQSRWLEHVWVKLCVSAQKDCSKNAHWVNGTTEMINVHLRQKEFPTPFLFEQHNGGAVNLILYYENDIITTLHVQLKRRPLDVNDITVPYPTIRIKNDSKNQNLYKNDSSRILRAAFDVETTLFQYLSIDDAGCSVILDHKRYVTSDPSPTEEDASCNLKFRLRSIYGTIKITESIRDTSKFAKISEQEVLICASKSVINYILANLLTYQCCRYFEYHQYDLIYVTVSRQNNTVTKLVPLQESSSVLEVEISPIPFVPKVHLTSTELSRILYRVNKTTTYQLPKPSVTFHSGRKTTSEYIDSIENAALQLYKFELDQSSTTEYREARILYEFFFPKISSATSDFVMHFSELNSLVIFTGYDDQHGSELWITDGNPNNTKLFIDLLPGSLSSNPTFLTAINGKVYFAAEGLDLSWTLDLDSCNGLRSVQASGEEILYIIARDPVWKPEKRYECPAGYRWITSREHFEKIILTSRKRSLEESYSSIFWNYCDWDGYKFGGAYRRYFRFSDSYINGVYQHAGRTITSPLGHDDSSFDFAGIICAKLSSGVDSTLSALGRELWVTDGSLRGTKRVRDIQSGSIGSNPKYLSLFSSIIVFQATTDEFGTELFKTDGTEVGTVMVADIWVGPRSSNPSYMTEWTTGDGRLYFAATSDYGRELWVSDVRANFHNYSPSGSKTFAGETSTYMLRDIFQGKNSSNPRYLVAATTKAGISGVFFSADDGVHGRELWVTDGTLSGTKMIVDLASRRSKGSNPAYLTLFRGEIYFQATVDEAIGVELYKTDGTSSNTRLVVNTAPGSAGSSPHCLSNIQATTRFGDTEERLYFVANDENNNERIWSYDGTNSKPSGRTLPGALQITDDLDGFGCKLYGYGNSILSAVIQKDIGNSDGIDFDFPFDCTVRVIVDKGNLLVPAYGRRQPSKSDKMDVKNAQELSILLKSILYVPPQDWAQSYDGSALTTNWVIEIILNGVNHTVQVPLIIPPTKFIPRLLTTLTGETILTKEDTIRKIPSISVQMCNAILDDPDMYDCIPSDAINAFNNILLELNASLQHGTFHVGYSGCLVSFRGYQPDYVDIYTSLDSGRPWKTATMVGSLVCLNQIMSDQMDFYGDGDYTGKDTLNISIRAAALHVSDRDERVLIGNFEQWTDQKSFTILIEPVNDAPYLLASQHYECDEDVPFLFPDLKVVDPDGLWTPIQLDIAAEYGSFVITVQQPNVKILSQAEWADLRMIGPVDDINLALSKMAYISKPNWNSLQLATNENFFSLATTFDDVSFELHDFEKFNHTTIRNVKIFVNPVQDAVYIFAPDINHRETRSSHFYEFDQVEDLTTAMRNVEFKIADTTNMITLKVELNVEKGVLFMPDLSLNEVSFNDGTENNERIIHFEGSPQAVNTAIQTLAYRPDTTLLEYKDVLILKVQSYDRLSMQFSPNSYLQVPLVTRKQNFVPQWELPKPDFILGSLLVWHLGESKSVLIRNASFTEKNDIGVDRSSSRKMQLALEAENGYFHLSRLHDVEPSTKILVRRQNENNEWRFLMIAAPLNVLNYILGEILFYLDQNRDVSRAMDVMLRLTINEEGLDGSKASSTQLHFSPSNRTKESALSIRTIEDIIEVVEDHVLPFNRTSHILLSFEDEGCCTQWPIQLEISCEHGEFVVAHSPGVSMSRKNDHTIYMEGYVEYMKTVLRNAVYVPHKDWYGADRIYFAILDGKQGSESNASIMVSVLPICDEPRFSHTEASRTEYVMKEDTEIALHLPLIVDPDLKESMTREISLNIVVTEKAGGIMATHLSDFFVNNSLEKTSKEAWLKDISIRGNALELNAVLNGLMYRPNPESYNSFPGAGLVRPMDEIRFSLEAINVDGSECDDTDDYSKHLTVFVQVDAVRDLPVLVSEAYARLPFHLGTKRMKNELDDREFCRFLASIPSTASAIEDESRNLIPFTIYDADISDQESNRILLNITGFGVRVYRDPLKHNGNCSMASITAVPQTSDFDFWIAMVGPQNALNCMIASQLMFVSGPDYHGISYIIVQISDLSFSGSDQEESSTYVLRVNIEAVNDIPKVQFPSYGTDLAHFVVEFGTEKLLTGAPYPEHLSKTCRGMADSGLCASNAASKAPISTSHVKWSLLRVRPLSANTTDRISPVTSFVSSEFSQGQFSIAALGLKIIFGGFDLLHGAEVWQSSGKSRETSMLKNLAPGNQSSSPSFLTYYAERNLVLFAAEGFDKSWMLKDEARDNCGGMRRSTINRRIAYVVADEERMKNDQVCQRGFLLHL